jgi:hypothetical protein
MKATELRIGNYIDYTTEREIVTMQTTYEYIRLIHNGNKNFEPIPLTEEWLLKFGFEKSDNEFYTETFKGDNKSDYYFCIRINDILCDLVICERVDEINNYDLICPKYINSVHQLQNLYFALTNEELTLTK